MLAYESALTSARNAAAERGEAARYAPGELSEAHTKLASAETAVTQKKMVVAEHYADESRAEAELGTTSPTVRPSTTGRGWQSS